MIYRVNLTGAMMSRREIALGLATPTAPILIGMPVFFVLRPEEYDAASGAMRSIVVIAILVATIVAMRVVQRLILTPPTLLYYRSIRGTLAFLLAPILGIMIYHLTNGDQRAAISSLGTFAFGLIMLLRLKHRESNSAERD